MKLIDILKEAFESKYSPSDFQLLSKKKEKNEFSKGYNMNYKYLLNDEDYTTLSGLKFNIKTIGYTSTDVDEKIDWSEYPKFFGFYYIQIDVYYKGKQLTGPSGIPGKKGLGYNYDLPGSVNKAKKWLEVNGEKLIQGKGYQYKST
jgi:hypothetical protein